MLRKLYLMYGYLVILTQLVHIELPVFSIVVGGYTIKYLLYYSFVAVSMAAWVFTLIRKKSARTYEWLLLLVMAYAFVTGLVGGYGFMTVAVDFSLYAMPVALYAWARVAMPSFKGAVEIFLLMNVASAVISVLVATRVISTDIYAAEGDLVRTAGAIDSTLAMGGFALCLVLLFTRNNGAVRINRVLVFVALASSILASMLAQSRTRIFLLLIAVVAIVIFNAYDRHGTKTLQLVFGIALALGLVYLVFSEQINVLISQIFDRFAETDLGGEEDINVSARWEEMTLQLSAFLKNVVSGLGFGSRTLYDDMYVHNVFTALLMQTGAVGFVAYSAFVLAPGWRSLVKIKRREHDKADVISLFLTLLVFVLSLTNAAALLAGGYFMLLITRIIDNDKEAALTAKETESRAQAAIEEG